MNDTTAPTVGPAHQESACEIAWCEDGPNAILVFFRGPSATFNDEDAELTATPEGQNDKTLP
jgi:hypothetical protein